MAMRMRPCDIKFTQDSVGGRFTCGKFVSNTFHQLLNGRITVDDIPTIEVVNEDGDWWAVTGNRRLYIYRILETLKVVEKIPVRVMSMVSYDVRRRFRDRNTTDCDGRTIRMRQMGAERLINEAIKEWQTTSGCTDRNIISADEALSSCLPEDEKRGDLKTELRGNCIQRTTGAGVQMNNFKVVDQNHNQNAGTREFILNDLQPSPLESRCTRSSSVAVEMNGESEDIQYWSRDQCANSITNEAELNGAVANQCQVEIPETDSKRSQAVTEQPKRFDGQVNYRQNSDGCCSNDCCCSCFSLLLLLLLMMIFLSNWNVLKKLLDNA